jgi:hypothetical protein
MRNTTAVWTDYTTEGYAFHEAISASITTLLALDTRIKRIHLGTYKLSSGQLDQFNGQAVTIEVVR